jgi:Putative beta-barrel porin-2, OmpL-like. bbp2
VRVSDVILSGSLFTGVAFANDEPKTVPARDEQPKKLDAAKTETGRQSDSDASETSAPQEPKRRALSAPLDPLFPGSEYLGPTPLIGVLDTDPEYPLEKAFWSAFPALKANRIKVYGWVNAGFDFSTSNKSNIPESYAIVPNKLELDQAVVRFERLPDTVQRDHVDWGFRRLTPMYGIDYRWTTAQGWFSGQLLNHNRLYGFDLVEAYGLVYIPNVAQGMVIKFGRYISPPNIEAQLAPDNYLYTHSLMFTFDCYTANRHQHSHKAKRSMVDPIPQGRAPASPANRLSGLRVRPLPT